MAKKTVVSLAEAKAHLRIEHDEEDDVLTSLLKKAQAKAETYCRAEFEDYFDDGVPEDVKLAILLMASHYYENRDNPDHETYNTMTKAFENLLYPYRDPTKMF